MSVYRAGLYWVLREVLWVHKQLTGTEGLKTLPQQILWGRGQPALPSEVLNPGGG